MGDPGAAQKSEGTRFGREAGASIITQRSICGAMGSGGRDPGQLAKSAHQAGDSPVNSVQPRDGACPPAWIIFG
jgi:hypothetical protein